MTYCSSASPNPNKRERCVKPRGHVGACIWIDGENLAPVEAGPVVHMAARGLVAEAMTIQHDAGECAWCDAERYRAWWRVDPERADLLEQMIDDERAR